MKPRRQIDNQIFNNIKDSFHGGRSHSRPAYGQISPPLFSKIDDDMGLVYLIFFWVLLDECLRKVHNEY